MRLTPSHRLYILGAILLVTLIICARDFRGEGEAFPIVPLLVAGVAYLLAIREFFYTPNFPKHVIVIGLVLAVAWHVAFLAIPTGSDDDVRRYVWDGRLQRLGYNPYLVAPNDPAFAALHSPETRPLNNPDLPSIYPPGAQLFFRMITAIQESTFAMRAAFAICNVGVVLVLLDVLRRTGQGAHWILAYAWHPLLATEVAGSGHIDILGVLLLVVSFAALLRRWRAVAAIAFALAVAVKFLPIVLLPLYLRRVRLRDALLAVIVFALLYLPFLNHGRIPTGSLGAYIQGFGFNAPVFAALRQVAAPQVVAGLAVLAGLLIAIWFRARNYLVARTLKGHGFTGCGKTRLTPDSYQGTTSVVPQSPLSSSSRAGFSLRGNPVFHKGHINEMSSISESPSLDAFAWPMAASLLCAPVVFPWYLLWLLPFLRS
ncbi:MAG TPA: glycosyltransferase 87 family protein, partial [Candidatus Angelobacter sp.]|nr:glycosyltransferase 87 family protein [Candidatus Angelobacter sp.]